MLPTEAPVPAVRRLNEDLCLETGLIEGEGDAGT
jgi:hypothetical protein